jgi:hypothetical protein
LSLWGGHGPRGPPLDPPMRNQAELIHQADIDTQKYETVGLIKITGKLV